jgi:hypothetical protein
LAFTIIKSLAAEAGRKAAAEAKDAGLPSIFVRNNEVICVHANGKEEVLTDRPLIGDKFYARYNPGTVLRVGK